MPRLDSLALFSSLSLLVLLAGCDESPPPADDAGSDAGAALPDAGEPMADAGPPADTWTNFGQAFFATYCTECHAGTPRNYTTLEGVRVDTDGIRCGVSPVVESGCGSFPPPSQFPVGSGPKPSDEDRLRLIAWIDAGLPE